MSADKAAAQPVPEEHAQVTKPVVCGGIGNARAIDEDSQKIWDMYKVHLEKKLRDQFKLAADAALKPVQVSTQVVAGMNYFFKVQIPENKYATARVYHVVWQADTHGQDSHVAVHPKLADSLNEDVGHF